MNKKTFTPRRKAFSLIELSIVLIIIGLLVAGVTGGASLIKNAELRSVMNEARGYQTAVNSFYAKFNALPGDYDKIIGEGGQGNNDGLINFYAPNSIATMTDNRMEGIIALEHLVNGSFIESNFTPLSANAPSGIWSGPLTPGTNIPGSKLKSAGWIFDNINSQNVVVVTQSVVGTISASMQAENPIFGTALTGIDSLSIDTKIDDGKVQEGKVRGYKKDDTDAQELKNMYCQYTSTTNSSNGGCALSFLVDPNA
jgi:prepilin-type N-terminal cleavage/methylation domain-containing protein